MYSESKRSVQFLNRIFVWLGTGGFHVSFYVGTNNWNVETYRKKLEKLYGFMSMLNHMFKTDTDHDLILYDACSTL